MNKKRANGSWKRIQQSKTKGVGSECETKEKNARNSNEFRGKTPFTNDNNSFQKGWILDERQKQFERTHNDRTVCKIPDMATFFGDSTTRLRLYPAKLSFTIHQKHSKKQFDKEKKQKHILTSIMADIDEFFLFLFSLLVSYLFIFIFSFPFPNHFV